MLRPIVPTGAGAGYSLISDGQIVAEGGLGHAGPDRFFDQDTAFRICSITKQFTAVLTMMAVHEGLLSLRAHPSTYYPGFGHGSTGLTIEHLLTNQSGLKDYWCLAMVQGAQPESCFTRKDADRLLRAPLAPDFAPGTRFAYSNTNFALLGRILERLFELSFPELVEMKIFDPLGMDASFVPESTAVPLPRGEIGFDDVGEAEVNISWDGDAGIVSTLTDMQRWQLAQLDLDHWIQPFFQACIASGTYADGEPAGYRYGIRRLEGAGPFRLSHTGGLRGWRMASVLEPQTRSAALVMFNHMADPLPPALAMLDGKGMEAFETEPGGQQQWLFAPKDNLAAKFDGNGFSCGSQAFSLGCGATLKGSTTGYHFEVPRDNVQMMLEPLSLSGTAPKSGKFYCATLESEINIEGSLSFSGPLGTSNAYEIHWLSETLAVIDCPRALDYEPPGQFTLVFDDSGLTLGCWSFQNVRFDKVAA